MIRDLFIVALFVLLEGTSAWITCVAIKALRLLIDKPYDKPRYFRCIYDDRGKKIRGIATLYASLILGVVSTLSSPFFFGLYVDSGKKSWLVYLIATSFVTVFSAVFLNMTVVYINDSTTCNYRLGGDFMKEMSLADEFALGVGFLSAGSYAAAYCSH